ncbi:YHS domain-containing (seleno)protein [Marinimicrococcus flavescens]|uniref:YHS domain-containing (Seleno)protein n=1 Tax=Marinimicrococcus flavescens TaxID=3031815 RepID=A0AAP3XRI6_9PROT|nr:YHS domain-containing (seleno)protein [Marinimicrococcus flavescens]
MRKLFLAAAVLPVLLASPGIAGEINASWLQGIAIKGQDPVAYFTESRPVEGSPEHELEWKGARWRFASATNRDSFAADPERWAPQYGGWCAYAVSENTTADIDPTAWRIVDGKLYLNVSPEIQRIWEQDIPGRIARADANWPAIRASLAE